MRFLNFFYYTVGMQRRRYTTERWRFIRQYFLYEQWFVLHSQKIIKLVIKPIIILIRWKMYIFFKMKVSKQNVVWQHLKRDLLCLKKPENWHPQRKTFHLVIGYLLPLTAASFIFQSSELYAAGMFRGMLRIYSREPFGSEAPHYSMADRLKHWILAR